MLSIGQVIIDKNNSEVLIFGGIGIYETKLGMASLSQYITEKGTVELYPGPGKADKALADTVVENLLNIGLTVKICKKKSRDITNFTNPKPARIPVGELCQKVIGEGAYMGVMDLTEFSEEDWDILIKTVQRFSGRPYKLVTEHSKMMSKDITYVVLDEDVF